MKAYCKILGYVLLAEFLTLFINLTLSVFTGTAFRVISAVCTVGILIALMVQSGYSIGTEDKKRMKADGTVPGHARPLLLSVTAMLPMQLCWLLLLLEKCSIFANGYYRFYKLLCAPFLQICNLFSADVAAASLPWIAIAVLQLLSWLPAVAVFISYRMTLHGKTLEDAMYTK